MSKKLKKHLSIDGQVAKLASRGLIIEDKEFAKEVLDRISYYRLTGYLHDLKKPGFDAYVDGLPLIPLFQYTSLIVD